MRTLWAHFISFAYFSCHSANIMLMIFLCCCQVTRPNHPFSFGVSLDSLLLQSTDSEWATYHHNKKSDSVSSLLYKVQCNCKVQVMFSPSLCININTGAYTEKILGGFQCYKAEGLGAQPPRCCRVYSFSDSFCYHFQFVWLLRQGIYAVNKHSSVWLPWVPIELWIAERQIVLLT